jgi:hypothetical protein
MPPTSGPDILVKVGCMARMLQEWAPAVHIGYSISFMSPRDSFYHHTVINRSMNVCYMSSRDKLRRRGSPKDIASVS